MLRVHTRYYVMAADVTGYMRQQAGDVEDPGRPGGMVNVFNMVLGETFDNHCDSTLARSLSSTTCSITWWKIYRNLERYLGRTAAYTKNLMCTSSKHIKKLYKEQGRERWRPQAS